MPTTLLTVVVLVPTALVVVALFVVLWKQRNSPRETAIAIASAVLICVWATVELELARRGLLRQPPSAGFPPIGVNGAVVMAALFAGLVVSTSLRRLLTNQANLLRMHLWRLEGLVFLILMFTGQMPALWALPAGIGDVIVGSTAFWVARRLEQPGGRRRAIVFNLLGLLDLVVAVGLGITSNAGPAQLFHTTPTPELLTLFPLALVPTFLVPLAFTIHVVSLWQLLGLPWSRPLPRTREAPSMPSPTTVTADGGLG